MSDTIVTEPFRACEVIWPPGTLTKPGLSACKLQPLRGQVGIEPIDCGKATDVKRFICQALSWGRLSGYSSGKPGGQKLYDVPNSKARGTVLRTVPLADCILRYGQCPECGECWKTIERIREDDCNA